MSEDYRSMWEALGLDLDAHDALLTVLGKGYGDIFLSQEDRSEGMGYFDFVMSEVHGLRIRELLKAEYDRFKTAMEELTGVAITTDSLKEGIRTVNAKRADYSMEDVGQMKTRVEAFVEQLRSR